MKATNTFSVNEKKVKFSDFISGQQAQALIAKSTSTPERASRLTATLISAVSASEQLRNCKPATILAAALRGEAMNLDLALGQFSIVPYGDTATYQLGAKGYKQLAIRSGLYDDFDVFDVREGEYKGRDPRTRAPIIHWIDDDDKREALPIVGYYGFYQLNADYNHFFRAIYWTHEKILKHAARYAKSFDLEKYRKMLAGELDAAAVEKMRNGSPWNDYPDALPHMKMCIKTITIQLLGDGMAPLSTDLRNAVAQDEAEEKGYDYVPADSPIIEVDTATGEVVSETPLNATESARSEKEVTTPTQSTKTRQTAEKPPLEANAIEATYKEAEEDNPFADVLR